MNKTPFQPERMHTVQPYLMVESVQELIAFCEQVFNASLQAKLDRPTGQIMHAEIRIGDSMIMAGEPMGDFGLFPCSLYVYVADCDRCYQQALAYGCEPLFEPTTMQHAGERYGGVKDKNGNVWWIATHVEDLTPEEQARRIAERKENWTEGKHPG